jgi:hypothetical protein
MNLKALVTMLVLGSSSVALARPVAVSGSAGASITVRDHRAPRDYRAPVPAPAPAHDGSYRTPPPFVPLWVTLGTESRIIDGAMAFRVNPTLRSARFSALKLQSAGGKSLIHRVEIQFANGRTQVVQLNQYLTAASPTITIDLAGDAARAIRNVTVVGRNARQSSYSVLAI